jgi:hypothetical protein
MNYGVTTTVQEKWNDQAKIEGLCDALGIPQKNNLFKDKYGHVVIHGKPDKPLQMIELRDDGEDEKYFNYYVVCNTKRQLFANRKKLQAIGMKLKATNSTETEACFSLRRLPEPYEVETLRKLLGAKSKRSKPSKITVQTVKKDTLHLLSRGSLDVN